MDQDATWYGGTLRRHCITWVLCSKGAQQPPLFVPVVAKQLAWIRIPRGMEVGLVPGDIVLDGDPALPRKGAQPSQLFSPCLLLTSAEFSAL